MSNQPPAVMSPVSSPESLMEDEDALMYEPEDDLVDGFEDEVAGQPAGGSRSAGAANEGWAIQEVSPSVSSLVMSPLSAE